MFARYYGWYYLEKGLSRTSKKGQGYNYQQPDRRTPVAKALIIWETCSCSVIYLRVKEKKGVMIWKGCPHYRHSQRYTILYYTNMELCGVGVWGFGGGGWIGVWGGGGGGLGMVDGGGGGGGGGWGVLQRTKKKIANCDIKTQQISCLYKFEYSFYPRPVLAFGYCRWLRLSVCVCGKHLLVRAITCHAFKLESPNLDNKSKTPWLRSL